ncbi:acyl-CoA dehydrogenase [Sphingobium sp. SJ10-10]|uniref:acyl-CoA dehydrogenase n=1 Tax=unclassified Sphingobium TaxID=2611147 RepID=UPI0018D39BEB|nr:MULTISPECIES: acyl-CoA dehydrogenase [unclassified Sphingobium]MEC6698204.1 acyl-CoA dehydrogenase [Sphingobium sp. SJ10-10]
MDQDPDQPPIEVLPPLWHWLYFLPAERQSNIGTDGHPRRDRSFMPSVTLPRRMWAGGRLYFIRPLMLGVSAQRTSRILSKRDKVGRSGHLVFLTLQHEISDVQGLVIREEQDIVYREATVSGAKAPAPPAAPVNEQFARIVTPDPILLMRYSALTFNCHRIHYDRPYAMQEEGYPGLVVHGPLIATLLMETLRGVHPERPIACFEFKAVSPLFDTEPFMTAGRVDGRIAQLWARGAQGQLAMSASAEFA